MGERGSEITVAPMALEHLRQVLDLGHQVYDVTLKPYTSWSLTAVAEHMDSGDSACWVALEGERVVGFVLGSMTFELRDDWAYLEWIAVAPDQQGKGVARRLVEACCGALFEAGASRVVTDVESTNTASATLMKRSGFEPVTTVTLFVRASPAEPGGVQDSVREVTTGSKRQLIRAGRLLGDRRQK